MLNNSNSLIFKIFTKCEIQEFNFAHFMLETIIENIKMCV